MQKLHKNLILSPDSLAEESEVPREIDWKEKQQPRNSTKEEEMDEIGISGSKVGEGALARDVRRLKSATLDRMGKMLKIHSKSGGEKPGFKAYKPDDAAASAASCGDEEPSRKQKFNSLTRMLRFSDKEDKSKSLGQYRGRSLTRILRRKVPIEGDNTSDKPDEHVRGIFSRIIGQIRGESTSFKFGARCYIVFVIRKLANLRTGRMSKADSTAENSSQKINKDSELSSGMALSELNLESSCSVASTRHED
ncbi:hypothetical protein TSAR_013879 [Trichomalopsis sarcophagae]|uniref:Uncharacterized protein n=1 Tax=Trichomalopsis sarcophagae TaxID=543379 RepID=A0A232FEE9_9HYME|nr:hypothetical protein TSAR_013879 [Trichomalopsis sarcophagae]